MPVARRVFFSFHYSRDIWRANVVRNCWLTHTDRTAAGFWDASLWEEAKLRGRQAIEQMIDDALIGTSVTVVLIGAETAFRDYVQYEVVQSYEKRKGLLGIYIHRIGNQRSEIDRQGRNPFDRVYFENNGRRTYLSEVYPSYHWFRDNGYLNIGSWIDEAAYFAGR
jgi:hypothetical protein